MRIWRVWRIWQRIILSAALAACAVGVVALVTFPSAAATGAGGAGAVTYTQTFKDTTERFPFGNPCTGAPGTATITFNAVMHVTVLTSGPGAGDTHMIGSETGDGVLTPTDPALPTYSGHFTSRFDDNDTLHNRTDTAILTIHATGTDGSTLAFHLVQHVSVSATGVTVSFDTLRCG
jgi:hypothetical protein